MDERRARAKASAPGLALALPLVCAFLVGALFVGQSLRAYRDPTPSPIASAEPSPAAAAPQPAIAQQPVQFIDLPPTVARNGSTVPSPDGSYLAAPSADYKGLAIVRVVPARDALNIKGELLATVPDTAFMAWMPDGESFIAQGTKVVNTTAKTQVKLVDVLRVDLAGTTTKLGEAWLVAYAFSPDGKRIATFNGDMRLIVIRTDGSGSEIVANDPGGTSFPLGWDAGGAILRFDERPPAKIHRILPSGGTASDLPVSGARYVAGAARWSPDRRAAIVTATVATASGTCDCDRLLTDRIVDMPKDALPSWIGPHTLLTRASDDHAGTVDVITGARTRLDAKMRSEKIRVLAVSLPYVLWLDETKNVPHVLDLAKDRDTGVGLNPPPAGAYPLANGRFLWWRDQTLSILDMNAWFAHYVDAHPTPSPVPQSKDQPSSS